MSALPWPRSPFVIVILSAAFVLAALYVIYRLVDPLPPRRLEIAAGIAGSGYDNFAKQYARILARYGVALEIRNSAGAVEDLDLLRDPGSGVQAALTTFGVTLPDDANPLLARRNLRCGDIHFLQESGAYNGLCAIPWQTPFRRDAGNGPALAHL